MSITIEEQFPALSNTGERFTVQKLQRWVTSPVRGSKETASGSFEWKTACGIDLQPQADGGFEMMQRDGILRRL